MNASSALAGCEVTCLGVGRGVIWVPDCGNSRTRYANGFFDGRTCVLLLAQPLLAQGWTVRESSRSFTVPAPGEPKVETISWDSEYGASFRAVSTGGRPGALLTHSRRLLRCRADSFGAGAHCVSGRPGVLDDRHHGVDRLRRHAIRQKPGVKGPTTRGITSSASPAMSCS